VLGSLFLIATTGVFAQTQHITVTAPFNQMDQDLFDQAIAPNIVQATAEIANDREGAERIMEALLTSEDSGEGPKAFAYLTSLKKQAFDNQNFYCIFHILRWGPEAAGKQIVQAQKWYLYHQGKLTPGNATTIPRLYGAGTFTFLFIHLNKRTDYQPLYEFDVEKKTPAYISHLLGLTGLFSTSSTTSQLLSINETGAAMSPNWWGLKTSILQYKTSNISAKPRLTRADTEVVDLGDPQKFDNEGKYFVDFSVGVPVRKISQLNFDSTNNTVTAKEVDKTGILALVNLYVPAVDIKGNNVNLIPHFVGGVAIAKQPLHKIFVGSGFGPVVANFYIGALFVKQEQLSSLKPGDAASPNQLSSDLRRRYKAQVAFGFNVPVGAIIEKLKGK
jgi:hypothetical protein